ncbi:MAG: ornithine cyclodeaminase family protein [Burkholderiaceae bacterium]|jgi:ornithine cyclodeaminase|nr:ornithine cyclodeaminase family protein [Burkholderiaceae bacterium]
MPNEEHLLLLDRDSVQRLLTPDMALAAVREAFVLHARREGRGFPVVREALPTGGVFGIKSGDVAGQDLLGFKAAGFWPGNRARGAEPHQATVLLFDPATGRPQCVIDGNALTTLRTGAAGALGLQCLARPDSATATVFGTGVQARVQLDFALRTLPTLRKVFYASRAGVADTGFEAAFAGRCDLQWTADADAAVARSDLVITATPGAGPLFDARCVRPGTHLNCVGADTRGKRELPPGLLPRCRLVVDDADQARQLGELQWSPDTPCQELGGLVAGQALFQRQATDISIFDMTGLALQDLVLARHLHQAAMASGAGTCLPWPWLAHRCTDKDTPQ